MTTSVVGASAPPPGTKRGAPAGTTPVECTHFRAFLARGGARVFAPLARCCIAANIPGNAPRTRANAHLVRSPSPTHAVLRSPRVAPPPRGEIEPTTPIETASIAG